MNTKYKNILFSGLIASVILVTTSCNLSEQEPYTGGSTYTASSPTVTINADDFQNIPGVEKDETYTYTITLSEPQIVDVRFQVFQSDGTATEGEDFDLGESALTIPAYELSASGSITTYADTDPEDTETLQITIGDETTANVIFTPQVYDFVLDNYLSPDLEISFDWSKDIDWNGTLYPTCSGSGNTDFDIFIFDGATFDPNDPMASFIGDFQAATGDCAETFVLSPDDYEDGDYVFMSYPYFNGFAGLGTDTWIPVVSTFVQPGAFQQTEAQDEELGKALYSDSPGADEAWPPFNEELYYIARVTIGNGTYVINGDVPAGKVENSKKSTNTLFPYSFTKTTVNGPLQH